MKVIFFSGIHFAERLLLLVYKKNLVSNVMALANNKGR